MSTKNAVRKHNNFGALRLFFASLVIFSHSPSILTGDRSLEPHFGPVTWGTIAVYGFFLVSGYLITKSFASTDSLGDYFRKRFLRIYPGYLVNIFLCFFVLAPLVGSGASIFSPHIVLTGLLHILFLGDPPAPGVFPGMPIQVLNGSVWTIAYEFRCYILVAVLGLLGFRRLRPAILFCAIACLIVSELDVLPEASGVVHVVLGTPSQIAVLTGMFAVGMLFYLYRERILYDARIAAAASGTLIVCSFVPLITTLSLAICGGYLTFWFALKCPVLPISKFANRTDLSYGIYLYAWPVQTIIAYLLHRAINAWILSFVALGISAGCAYLSWIYVEKPSLALAHRRRHDRSSSEPASSQA